MAVAGQTDSPPLAHQVVRQRSRHDNSPLAGRNPQLPGISSNAETDKNDRGQRYGWLLLLDLQTSHTRRAFPVYSTERITGAVVAHADHARRVSKNVLATRNRAEGRTRRQVNIRERYNSRIDDQRPRLIERAAGFSKTEQVASGQYTRPNLIVAAALTDQAIVQAGAVLRTKGLAWRIMLPEIKALGGVSS